MRLRRRLANERHPDNEPLQPQPDGRARVSLPPRRCAHDRRARRRRARAAAVDDAHRQLPRAERDVVRRPHETDGRQVVVELSDAGRARLLADRDRRDAWLNRRLRDLTPEERAILRKAAPILENLAHRD